MTYVRAVEAADALAVVVPPVGSRDVPRLVARLDGLVLSGGPDLAPDAYGASPHHPGLIVETRAAPLAASPIARAWVALERLAAKQLGADVVFSIL